MSRDFREIATHPAFTETYQGGLREVLERNRLDLENADASDPVTFARIQERVVFARWVLEIYPRALTGEVQVAQHNGHEEEEGTYQGAEYDEE